MPNQVLILTSSRTGLGQLLYQRSITEPTHQLRFPQVLSFVFILIAFALEFIRVTLLFFKSDQEKGSIRRGRPT